MKTKRCTRYILSTMLLLMSTVSWAESKITWREYSPAIFQQAQQEKRLILLDLVAVWCHWCHVMDEKTYTDTSVIKVINEKYLPVKADHDARPDLAERYRDYGWPANIIITPDGRELHKQAGYISAAEMLELLESRSLTESFVPTESKLTFSLTGQLSSDTKKQLLKRHVERYDNQEGGLDIAQKFLDEGAIQWDFYLSGEQTPAAERARQRVIQTLDAGLKLIDPEFGGAYQYSTGFSWDNPHYEKIMLTQSRYLRLYSMAYELFGFQRYLDAAIAIASYLDEFMTAPNGGFYTSQDADLLPGQKSHQYFASDRSTRLKLGLPRIDKNQYTAQSAMAMEGLIELYRVSGKNQYLSRVVEALKWVSSNRRLAGGGFRHAEQDPAGPYLDDNLYMGRTYLKLFEITNDTKWLKRAQNVAMFMQKNFTQTPAGLLSAADNGTPIKPVVQIDQNIAAADFLIRLVRIETTPTNQSLLRQVMRYLVTPEIALSRPTEAGILYLNENYRQLPNKENNHAYF